MLRVLLSIGPIGLLIGAIGFWAEASELPVAHRIAAEICREPGLSAMQLSRTIQPRRHGSVWLRRSDERPTRWLHRRFLANYANGYWIIAKSRSDAGRLSRVWVDIGTVDDRQEVVTLVSTSFDGQCRLLEVASYR